jgi:hypothetical protein
VKNFSKKALTTFNLASAGCEVKKDMEVQIAGGTERERERERLVSGHTLRGVLLLLLPSNMPI